MNSEIEIFLCYAREDERLCQELENQLRVLQKQGLIKVWYDRKIIPGREWAHEIDAHLNTAQIILLLVSTNFVVSEYCYGIEMERALERHERGEACVIPVILSPTLWNETPFGKLQALPRDSKPVTMWPNKGAAFFNVADGILRAIKDLSSRLPGDHSWRKNPKEESTPASAGKVSERTGVKSVSNEILAFSKVPEYTNINRYLPVYILLNISRSMKGVPVESLNQGLELFRSEVISDPFARDVVKVGVITFSNEAQLVANRLMHISKFLPPHLAVGGKRSRLDLAFKVLLQSIDRDVKKGTKGGVQGDWRPVIFVLMNEMPTDKDGKVTDRLWQKGRDALINRPKGQIRPGNIIAVGLGPNVDDVTLRNISTGTVFKMGTDAVTFVTLFQYLSQSISNSVRLGDNPGEPDIIRIP